MNRGDLVGPVVIHSTDAVEYANEAFCDLVGVDAPASLAGQPFDRLVADGYREALADRFECRLRNQGSVHGVAIEPESLVAAFYGKYADATVDPVRVPVGSEDGDIPSWR